MTIAEQKMSVKAFDQFVELPENEDKFFEYVGGEVVEVPSNTYSSKIALRFGRLIGAYVDDNELGHATGEQGGYMVNGERYAPDAAYISFTRQPEVSSTTYNPNPPDLAVEVVSSDTSAENRHLTIKLSNYLAAGTVVWIVRPHEQYVEVHRPGLPPFIVQKDEVLEGGDVLPGFTLKLSEAFK